MSGFHIRIIRIAHGSLVPEFVEELFAYRSINDYPRLRLRVSRAIKESFSPYTPFLAGIHRTFRSTPPLRLLSRPKSSPRKKRHRRWDDGTQSADKGPRHHIPDIFSETDILRPRCVMGARYTSLQNSPSIPVDSGASFARLCQTFQTLCKHYSFYSRFDVYGSKGKNKLVLLRVMAEQFHQPNCPATVLPFYLNLRS